MTYGGSRRVDLAQRLVRSQRALKGRLGRPEGVLAVMRAAHESLDAAVIGEQVVALAVEWFKSPSCGVFAADLDGQVSPPPEPRSVGRSGAGRARWRPSS